LFNLKKGDEKSRETVPLKVKYLSEFESIFENTVDHISEDQLGTFSEITLDKKSHATIPLKNY
jgi:hypothetical protein